MESRSLIGARSLTVIVFLIAGCSIGFLERLTPEHRILGYPALETVLVVERDFAHQNYVVPSGVYYPDSGFNNGRINYAGRQPVTVQTMLGAPRVCEGGVSVNVANPYGDYELFAYYCGDPVTVYSIPKQLKFRIEKTDRPHRPPSRPYA